jgi:hypothetical protein
MEQRGGHAPGVRSVANKLLQAEGQAARVVLDGRSSGLTSATARAGVAMYAGLPHRGNVAAVRVIGDGFDLAWTRARTVETHRRLDGYQTDNQRRFRRLGLPDVGLGG